jgi:Beta-galactosidase
MLQDGMLGFLGKQAAVFHKCKFSQKTFILSANKHESMHLRATHNIVIRLFHFSLSQKITTPWLINHIASIIATDQCFTTNPPHHQHRLSMIPRHHFLHSILATMLLLSSSQAEPSASWPHWPEYHKTPLSEIRPQAWQPQDHVIDGWDWSLPPDTKPASTGLLAVYRVSSINKPLGEEIKALNLPVNPTLEFWVKWRDLEPVEGQYKFDLLQKRIAEAEQRGCSVVLRILSSATIFSPVWLEAYKIPHRSEPGKNKAKVTNYEISHPEFHKRYLALINMLGESKIPQIKAVKGAYVGYASPSYGDEGIGPHGVNPDTVPHVIERLDAWSRAFAGVRHKVFMGGESQKGSKLGFGTRRGFVEMFLYHIPSPTIGQTLDKQGYLYVDDSVEVIKSKAFHGEENEEYEEAWATKERGFRFGETTDSYTYRYFVSNLRTLQMQCNHVLMNPFSLIPSQMVWVGQSLGRTVDDSPDIWCALRESYIHKKQPVKNFERWLYQRDTPGFETIPTVKIPHPIKMWMVAKDQNYDYIARQGKKIGFAVDDRWAGGKAVNIAIKTTYFDQGSGTIDIQLLTNAGPVTRNIALSGSGKLKTATIFVNDALFSAKNMDYDVTYQSSTAAATISFVRIIRLQ